MKEPIHEAQGRFSCSAQFVHYPTSWRCHIRGKKDECDVGFTCLSAGAFMSDCLLIVWLLRCGQTIVCFTNLLPSKISAASDACNVTKKAKHA